MILCARSRSRSSEQSRENKRARTSERLVYSITEMTELYDYQTWLTHFLRSPRGAQRFVGLFVLTALFGCWLAGHANSDHVGVVTVVISKTGEELFMDKGAAKKNMYPTTKAVWLKTYPSSHKQGDHLTITDASSKHEWKAFSTTS